SATPLFYNTALSFLLCALALLSCVWAWNGALLVSALLLVALSLPTLGEYIQGVVGEVQRLWLLHDPQALVAHPGGMAPSAAFCFALTGVACLFLRHPARFRSAPLVMGTSGAVIGAVGLMSLGADWLGLVLHRPGVWEAFVHQLRVQAAAGFLVLGLGIVVFSWRARPDTDGGGPRWLPVAGFFALLSCWVLLWRGAAGRGHGLHAPAPPP